jgi:hypothetical protein
MRRYQDSGESNCRKGKTEHVTSPVEQNAGRTLSFHPIVLTNEGWPQVLGDIYEVFHFVEERFASASATAATYQTHLLGTQHREPGLVRSTFVPGQVWAT